ncbi:hypothetical protein [Streptacidiphilus sp. EB129]|uniref:hypothetical protein n=1 Tax=Streptacidiphilus sp. EB129 TaxID=3156262 RepID=UPI003519D2B7
MKQTTGGSRARRGHLRRLRPLATVLVAAAGMIGAAAAPAATAPTAGTTSAAPATGASSSTGTNTRTVTLATGDRVIVTTVAGRTRYTIDPAVPGDAAFQSYRDAQGDYHVVPALAEPFLGGALDPSLFDVTAQLRSHAGTGATADAETGTVAEVSPGTATQLVAALRQAVGADVRAGRRPGTTVPHLTGVPAAPGNAGPAPVRAAAGYPQRILQVDVTDRSGRPADGQAMLMNTDSSLRFMNMIPINGGVDRVAVPAGNYSIDFGVETYDAQGNVTSAYAVTRTDFTVPATGTVPDLVLNGRSAAPVRVATPLPTVPQLVNVGWFRTDASSPDPASNQDSAMGFDYTVLGSIPFAMNAQPAARVGTVSSEVQWIGGNTKGGYRYDTVFSAADVPDVTAYRVTSAQLATEHNHYYTDPAAPGRGAVYDMPYDYANPGPMGPSALIPQSMPADVTEYLSVVPHTDWIQQAFEGSGIVLTDDPAAFGAGTTTSVDWGRGPLAPGVGRHTILPGTGATCQACLAGTDLRLNLDDFDDSTPGQQGWPGYQANGTPMQVTSSLSAYQNGQLLGTTPGGSSLSIGNAPATGATYTVVYGTNTTTPLVSQSTSTDTTLVFSTTPAAESGAALTPLGNCAGQSTATPCLVLPLLNIGTRLATSEEGTATPGTETMGLSIGHVSYNDTGSHAAITSATVQVSFDGGRTWQAAHLTGTGAASAGDYTASWTNPVTDTGTYPSIRITATDAVGGSISQTVNHAYEIVKGA